MERKQTIIATQMRTKTLENWTVKRKHTNTKKRPKIYQGVAVAAGILLVGACAISSPASVQVMNRIDSGFDYDETLGRLQYVSNILPESAMVFLSSGGDEEGFISPSHAEIVHAWSQNEPWLEFAGNSDVFSCSPGEVMAVIKNGENRYTVRLRHENGYESVYSGLSDISVWERETIAAGECMGIAVSGAAFELRKDGLSILPIFETK